MKKFLFWLPVAGLVVPWFSGCSSMPQAYCPQRLGSIASASAMHGIQITISPESEVTVKGEPIRFDVEIENVSARSVLVPRRPHIMFIWTYSNGRRDNFLTEAPAEQFYRPQEVVQLEPGARLQIRVPVATYYFSKLGITEFCAIVESPRNTNPALGEVWQGRAASNRFGVMVTDRNEYASGSGGTQLASLR